MTDTTTVVAVPAEPASVPSIIDWPAVFAGALIASALWLVLFAFGSAAGISAVSPYSWDNPSATTMTIVGVAWFSVTMIFSYMAGGYFAGRFRRPFGDGTLAEREQRDGAQGLVVWAVSLLIGVMVMATVAIGAARTVATAAGGAAGVAAQAVPQDRVGGVIDQLLRPAPGAAGQAGAQDPRADIGRILSSDTLSRGEISNADRDYIAGVVATRAQIPPEEARKRVDAAIEQAKEAADTARKIAAALAFLIGATSILAAGAAYWAAGAGGRQRDENLALR